MSAPNGQNSNARPPFQFGEKVKLCGLYKKKRQKDGKTYLTSRLSYTSKFLILPNDEKKSDSEPDFWVYLVADEVKPKAAPIVTVVSVEKDDL